MNTVTITEDQLKSAKACDAYLTSPEWDEKKRALVYKDFDATVKRLNSSPFGQRYLGFLISKKLVPLTKMP